MRRDKYRAPALVIIALTGDTNIAERHFASKEPRCALNVA